MTMLPHSTIPALFAARVEADAGKVALHCRAGDSWQVLSWSELAHQVRELAELLRASGVQAGDRVAQVSENRREWIVADLAIMTIDAVHVPMHTPLAGPQIAWQIAHSQAKTLLVSTQEMLAKALAAPETLPAGTKVFSYEAATPPAGAEAFAPRQIVFTPASPERAADDVAYLKAAAEQDQPGDLATILYTSGTTGDPKGVMLSHENLAFNARATVAAYGEQPEDVRLNFLPLSHIYARTCDLYTWLVRGTQLAVAKSRETVAADMQRIKPTLINGVPYFYRKLMRHLIDRGHADQPGAVQQIFGGRLRMASVGGAALPLDVYDFFYERGIKILQGYGLTESSPVISLSTPDAERRGAVGRPLAETECRIADDGEICVRGPHVMQGYWRNQEATDEVLKNGWLHTGDLGRLDDDGFLHITGRKKELLVLMTGKKIIPSVIESLLTREPYILQACVVGEGKGCLGALIVPDPDRLRAWVSEQNLFVFTPAQAVAHEAVRAFYQEKINAALADCAHHEQVRVFTILDRGFTPESGELTPKLSLRRGEIVRNCAAIIEAMFNGATA
jgi:long-chain acyl-CoA synthetase